MSNREIQGRVFFAEIADIGAAQTSRPPLAMEHDRSSPYSGPRPLGVADCLQDRQAVGFRGITAGGVYAMGPGGYKAAGAIRRLKQQCRGTEFLLLGGLDHEQELLDSRLRFWP